MDISIKHPDSSPPTRFANSISMVIKSFKGRRDVEVHLFRAQWDSEQEAHEAWKDIILSDDPATDTEGSRRVVMESFTDEERDIIVNYLREQYANRLTAIRSVPLSFPVPAGLSGLSQLEPCKNTGFIDFERIPSYSLDIPIKGLFDLSQHPPIVDE